MIIECETGARVDLTVEWTPSSLIALGCRPDLAADLAAILTRAGEDETAGTQAGATGSATVALASTAIAGLSPIGDGVEAAPDSRGARRGWPRWARVGRRRTPPDPASPAPATRLEPGDGTGPPASSRR
jgi:hypothetical protein